MRKPKSATRFRTVDSVTAPGVLGFVRRSLSGCGELLLGSRGEPGVAMLASV